VQELVLYDEIQNITGIIPVKEHSPVTYYRAREWTPAEFKAMWNSMSHMNKMLFILELFSQ